MPTPDAQCASRPPPPWLHGLRRRGAFGALVAGSAGLAMAALLGGATSAVERLDEIAFDAQARLIRLLRAPAPDDAEPVVVVGIDEATLDAQGVPLAMMHAALGRALEAIAGARPRAIGLDIALPGRSFDPLAPGLDLALMRGLHAARGQGLVLAVDVDADGGLRMPALPLLAAAGGAPALGLPLFPLDCDGTVRRFDPQPGAPGAPGPCAAGLGRAPDARAARSAMPTFAARLAAVLGVEARVARPGWIDFTRGAPIAYLPLRTVIAWYDAGDHARLQARFEGRAVLLGSVLPYLDRLRLPVALAAWEPRQAAPPGVIVNAQVLRNALGSGLVRPVPPGLDALACLALAALVAAPRPGARALVAGAVLPLGFLASTALHARGIFLGPAAALLAAACTLAVRGALDLAGARADRARLARRFGAYLSPALLRALLDDRLEEGGTRRPIALLFADLRGFTRWSETADAACVRAFLNEYYARITPLLHGHGGTIDNFRGDGVMAMFGAPEPLPGECDAAFAAARALVAAVESAARTRVAAGAPLSVAVGLAYGEVVFGDVGSAERKDFTALGDAVNVAARLQDLAKALGYPVLMTHAFAQRLSARDATIVALGARPLAGHSPVEVFAWRAPPAQVAATR